MTIEPFTKGPRAAKTKLNKIVDTVNQLNRIIGDGIIRINHTPAGYALSLDINQLMARVPKNLVPPSVGWGIAIAASTWHGLALKNDGSIAGWGDDTHGQSTPPR